MGVCRGDGRGKRVVEQVAVNPWVALAYLVAGVCFILALRGLSSPQKIGRAHV